MLNYTLKTDQATPLPTESSTEYQHPTLQAVGNSEQHEPQVGDLSVVQDIAKKKMVSTLEQQRRSFIAEGKVKIGTRIHRIERALSLLLNNKDRLVEAMRADFGHRSTHQSLLTDIAGSVTPLRFAIANLRKWMRPARRGVRLPWGLFGARARIEYQPLGVVGLIGSWNLPVQLIFGPLASIFAAGNRAMVKPSEFTPETSNLIEELFLSTYDPREITVVNGGADITQIFSTLPFDHLMFSGSSRAGQQIIRATAEHQVPLTLELGGKSPAILGRGAPMWTSVSRIMLGKTLNAGQSCHAPDYVMIPQGQVEDFVETAHKVVAHMFPTLLNNPDYSSLINEQHYGHLQNYLEDAREKGGVIVTINPKHEDFKQQPYFKMPPTLVLNPHDSMHVMQEEIFGPILPVRQYNLLEEAINYVNARNRAPMLYYFGNDKREESQVLTHTMSGGVVINDTMTYFCQDDLPFGGLGSSGLGTYKGEDGFRNFSHRRSIFNQSTLDVAKVTGIMPPWGSSFAHLMKRIIKF